LAESQLCDSAKMSQPFQHGPRVRLWKAFRVQFAFSTTSTKWRVLWKYKVVREIFKSLGTF
jgi:hypothetical protein